MARVTLATIFFIAIYPGSESTSCTRRSCHGDVGNLGIGRSISASNACKSPGAHLTEYCHFEDGNCNLPECKPCPVGARDLNYPSMSLFDSPFSLTKSFWQSELLPSVDEKVTLKFDLETAFYFTHLIMVFKTPRPGAMVLERSVDNGKTWQVYQRYAKNCESTFGLPDSDTLHEGNCTSAYSTEEPCSGGEVIYRVLNPVDPIGDPYSAESRYLMKITNLRIQMWLPQVCSKCMTAEENLAPFQHFAIYDLIIRGTCFCNGHADSCIPLETSNLNMKSMGRAVVHGKCVCEHNTAGDHCEKCLPLYNDAPWRSGNGYTGKAHPCKRCVCHGHAESCHFDTRIWSLTGQTSGGVCDDCGHNTTGRACHQCKDHFFRRPDSDLSDPDVCQECECHPDGTETAVIDTANDDVYLASRGMTSPCDQISGQCTCKYGVTGRRCDRCRTGFWGLGPQGCNKCLCTKGICDQVSGECVPDYDSDALLIPHRYQQIMGEYIPRFPEYPFFASRFPDYDSDTRMAASWRRPGSCVCKDKELENSHDFCKMKYDYAMKVRVLSAEDDGTTTILSVTVKRVIKQNRVKIRRGKMFMYPESWTQMGCTCPALIPKNDYIVAGHEDFDSYRLIVNTDSFVKRWNHSKKRSRAHRILRSKCY